jgi:hypothetical protein
MKQEEFYFTSTLFQISKGEDEETNPGCYGKELGEWLCSQLKALGYEVEDLVAEDWGWCVVCVRKPYLLWAGCVAMPTADFPETYDPDSPPRGEDVVWCVFPVVELPFFYLTSHIMRIFGQLDLKAPLQKLTQEIQGLLEAEPKIERYEETTG